MKLINITPLLVVAVSLISNLSVSANENSDQVNAFMKNLRHLGTGEKPVKGAAKKEKKVKGDSADNKEKMSPKVKSDSDKKKGQGVKGESNGKEENEGSNTTPKTKPPKVSESKTKKPSKVFESDYPSNLVSLVPTEVPV